MAEFTRAAEEALNEYVATERDKLVLQLTAAATAAADRNGSREVTIREVAEVIARSEGSEATRGQFLRQLDRANYKSNLYQRLGLTYLVFGLLGALVLTAVQVGSAQSSGGSARAATFAFASVLGASLGFVVIFTTRSRGAKARTVRAGTYHELGQFVARWQVFETGVRAAVDDQDGTLRAVIEQAVQSGIFTTTDVEQIRHLLRTRNAVVHEPFSVRDVDLREAYSDLARFSEKLDNWAQAQRA